MEIKTERQGKITHIGQLLPEMLSQPVPFEMVELTKEETELAIKEAMVKKHARLEDQRRAALVEARRNDHMKPWTPNELYLFAKNRATQLLRYETGDPSIEFSPKEFQKDIIAALCLYFTESQEFNDLDPKKYNNTGLEFSLQKGLWLWGNPGVGKTLLMNIFSRNKRQCYQVVQCPKIVSGYVKYGDDHIERYSKIIPVEGSSFDNFFQKTMGICYNDLGIETLQAKHYGTAVNVMETIFLDTYERKVPFFHRHVTTNLTFDQVKEKYGVRITDRIKQCFNVIEIKGESIRR